jgi:hypothetical protein
MGNNKIAAVDRNSVIELHRRGDVWFVGNAVFVFESNELCMH